jgi:hypothetical protein
MEAEMKVPSAKGKDEKKSRVIISVPDGSSSAINESTQRKKPAFEDLHAHISIRAYELYLQRGCREGHAQEDWLDAEQEIIDREFPA